MKKKFASSVDHVTGVLCLIFSLATGALAQAPSSASFLASDTATQGNWASKYGADGYFIANSSYQSSPGYAVFMPQNDSEWTWASGTSDPRALTIPGGSGGIASCSFSGTTFTLDVNLTDGNAHQVALYALDWDPAARVETIQIVDANNPGNVLSTQSVSNFSGGIYLLWTISGHVKINVTSNGPQNAVISGVFFGSVGTAAPRITSAASTTFSVGIPSTFTVTATGFPAPALSESGALPSGVTFNSTTGVLSGTPGAGTMGSYPMVFTASNSGGSNPQNFTLSVNPAPVGPTASFVGPDTATQGNWASKYGADGYFIASSSYQSSGYAVFTPQNESEWTWVSGTSDPRALTIPGGSGIASCWFSSTTFTLDVNLTDGNAHQVALYALDWDPAARVETIQIVDANNPGNVLSTQSISNFSGGIYLLWTISGHVKINVTSNGPLNAVISGVFFGSGNNVAIAPAPLSITTASLANGQVGTAYSQTLAATGGTTPYTWSFTSGTLPGGLTLNASTGLISGTPTAVANATALTFKVTDSTTPTNQTNTVSLTITITGPSVLLSWVASTSPATSGYNVYRSSTSGSGYTRINISTVLGLTYTDTIVVSGQTYYYVTTAGDSNGDESPFSNEIQVIVP